MMQAVRTPSDERRQRLADLLHRGLSASDLDLVERQALLRLLEQLNDEQNLILMKFGSFRQVEGDVDRVQFIQKHRATLAVEEPAIGDGEEVRRRWTMFSFYVDGLVSRGLLRDTEGVGKSQGSPRVAVNPLGKLLLETIGLRVEPTA
jgi:hypothetical protein